MKLSFLLVLLLSTLALVGAGEKPSENPIPSPRMIVESHEKERSGKKDGNETKNRQAEQPPLIIGQHSPAVGLVQRPIPDIELQERSGNQSNKTPNEWWLIAFTAALVVVAVLQLILYSKQVRHFRTVERAWLAVMFDHPFQPKVGRYNPINYSVKNVGHTVALLKPPKINALPWNGSIPERELAPKPTGAFPTRATIFPGDKFTLEGLVDIDFTQQMINDAATGRFIFDVYGYVTYDDAFGNRRITRFCQVYNPGGDGGSFTYPREAQPEYNDAD